MFEFILPVIAYLITLLVLWATVAITKFVATRVSTDPRSGTSPWRSMPSTASRPMMVGTRTQ